ncbi:MAG: mechanosensitive ion channel [Betaproteobacteria bacterium]|nr:mechanosensitive ion channel [Betaproteobacteria bacterium]
MSPLEKTLEAVATQLSGTATLVQAGVIATGLALGWFVGNALRRRVADRGVWAFGEGGFERVANPLVALAAMWAARLVVRKSYATHFIDVAIGLIAAFAIIRFTVYVLRHVLPQGSFRRGSERTIAIAIWVGFALHFTGLLPEVWEALDSVGFTAGKQRISLLLVLQGLTSVAVTLAITLWLASLVEGRLLSAESIELSTRVVIAKVVRALAFLLAILVALPIVGIDLTALAVFSGALGAGVGLGLQKIASNYVSGFIILLDRSVRIGDLVTIDNRHGVVKAIESRYTVIRSLDGTESILPNETLITQSVTNHSFTDPKMFIKVKVSVGYDSDIDRVYAILTDCAKSQARVLAEPPPAAWISALGDNGIDVELGFWIADPDQGQSTLRGEVLRGALEAFRAEGIEIPFPKRDVTVVTGSVAP